MNIVQPSYRDLLDAFKPLHSDGAWIHNPSNKRIEESEFREIKAVLGRFIDLMEKYYFSVNEEGIEEFRKNKEICLEFSQKCTDSDSDDPDIDSNNMWETTPSKKNIWMMPFTLAAEPLPDLNSEFTAAEGLPALYCAAQKVDKLFAQLILVLKIDLETGNDKLENFFKPICKEYMNSMKDFWDSYVSWKHLNFED